MIASEMPGSDERAALRASTRELLSRRCDSARLRAALGTESGYDDVLWDEACGLGWAGLMVPEAHGGMGGSFSEVSVIIEELGAVLSPVPFISSVLASAAVQMAGTPDQQQATLRELAEGTTRAALALPQPTTSGSTATLRSRWKNGSATLDGRVDFVLDGEVAQLLVVAAMGVSGWELFMLPADAAGIVCTHQETIDTTRRLASLTFSGTVVDQANWLPGSEALPYLLDLAASSLATDCVGGAQRLLDLTVRYVGQRTQFGRPVGSFQAVKHMCADMYLLVEGAKVVAAHAASTLSQAETMTGPRTRAVAVAKSYCADAYARVAGLAMQAHGGIGFTWEHDTHLYFKRAKLNRALFGDSTWQRERLASQL